MTMRARALGLGGEIAKAAAVGLAGQALAAVVVAVAGGFAVLIWTGGSLPAWVVFLVVVVLVVVAATLLGQQYRSAALADEDSEGLKTELRHSERYSGLVQDALDALQRVISGDVGDGIDRFIEQAVLEPAQRILGEKPAENVRLSVLLPSEADPERWSMRWSAGHTMVGRHKYDQLIAETMARHAYERSESQCWGDIEAQTDFRQNPEASAPTRSLASIPILNRDLVLGVFNAISSEKDAFDDAEQKFLLSLAGIIAVAVSVWGEAGGGVAKRGPTGKPSSLR
jgi:GAF domain-containing protein